MCFVVFFSTFPFTLKRYDYDALETALQIHAEESVTAKIASYNLTLQQQLSAHSIKGNSVSIAILYNSTLKPIFFNLYIENNVYY